MRLRTFAAVMTALLITAAAVGAPIEYPKTKKVEQVDDYHGTKVADPYRWLETDVRTSKDVADWVVAENKITFDYLGTIPEREPIRKQLTTLWNYEKYSTPFKRGGHYFFSKNNGLQNQSVLYTVDKWGDTPRVLLDPNSWSKDGTIALDNVAITDDAKYAAYSTSEAGSDWQVIKVVEVASGKQLPDEIKWVKFSSASWTKDGKGFFYSRYDEPKPGQTLKGVNYFQKLYYHRLGQPQSDVDQRPAGPAAQRGVRAGGALRQSPLVGRAVQVGGVFVSYLVHHVGVHVLDPFSSFSWVMSSVWRAGLGRLDRAC